MEDLTKTITYYYIKDDSIFETVNDRNNFINIQIFYVKKMCENNFFFIWLCHLFFLSLTCH